MRLACLFHYEMRLICSLQRHDRLTRGVTIAEQQRDRETETETERQKDRESDGGGSQLEQGGVRHVPFQVATELTTKTIRLESVFFRCKRARAMGG